MDPYEVLGVSKDADEETIERAYKELVKKYHPDKYVNNPLADLAAEKMKEINKAHDMIKNGQTASSNSYGGYSGHYGGYRSRAHYDTSYNSARMLINSGRLQEAENMLNQLPQNAEWFYLMGVIYQRRGWYDKATDYIERAASMDPNNPEYRSARDQMNNQRTNFNHRTTVYGAPNRGMSTCDCCSNLLIADCCCECMGGDLIPCC